MRLKPVLKSYVTVVHTERPHAVFTTELAEVSRTNQLYFQICCVVLLLLFTLSCGLVVRFMNDPSRLGALFAVTGISIVGLVAQMVWLWKQKVTADVVAVLARHLRPRDVRGVIEILFAKL